MNCIKGYEIKVMKSAAGYYIGTSDEDGFPMCRISSYYQTKELAQKDLDNCMFHREAEEIYFCNRGMGCIPHDEEPKEYCVSGETMDGIEVEDFYEDFDDAKSAAGVIIEEGGFAYLTDEYGNEYDPFD